MKKLIFVLILVVLTTYSIGCSKKTNNDGIIIAQEGFQELNPITTQTRASWNIMYLYQSQLVRFYNEKIDFDAAESFEKNKKNTVYTFHIREGLKWSDGSILDANDFAYGIKVVLDPESASPKAGSFYEIKNAQKYNEGKVDFDKVGVKVIDDLTLQLTLENPCVDFEKSIASAHYYPVSEEFIKKVGIKEYGSSVEKTLSSGPYVLTELDLNKNIKLVKNNDYWDALNTFKVESVEFIKVENMNTAISMYDNEEIDAILELSSEYYEQFEGETFTGATGRITFLWLNQYSKDKKVSKVISNKNFRKALTYALNREEISELDNANKPINSFVGLDFAGNTKGKTFNEEYPVKTVANKGDATQAKEYLKKALKELNYKSVKDLPEINFVTYVYEPNEKICELTIDNWRKVLGLDNIKFTVQEFNTSISTFYSLDYDVFEIPIETNIRPSDLMNSITTDSVYNAGIIKNDKFDKLVKDAIKESDEVKKAKLIQEANQLLLDETYMIPIVYNGFKSAVKPYVQNYRLGSVDGFEFQNLEIK